MVSDENRDSARKNSAKSDALKSPSTRAWAAYQFTASASASAHSVEYSFVSRTAFCVTGFFEECLVSRLSFHRRVFIDPDGVSLAKMDSNFLTSYSFESALSILI